jgi:hypothetical protein
MAVPLNHQEWYYRSKVPGRYRLVKIAASNG